MWEGDRMKKVIFAGILTTALLTMNCNAFGATAAFGDTSMGNHPLAPYAESSIIVPRPEKSAYMNLTNYINTDIPSDVRGHWAESYINFILQNGYMSCNGSGQFQPDAAITYAEFAQTIARLGLKPVEFNGGSISYKVFQDCALWIEGNDDVTAAMICAEVGIWGNPSEANASINSLGLRLYDIVERQYITWFLSNMMDHAGDTALMNNMGYCDATLFNNMDMLNIMNQMVGEGIITGFPDNTIRPQGIVTKAEFATMLYKVLERYGFDIDDINNNLYGNYHRYFWNEESRLMELVNEERRNSGISTLRYDSDLNALCEIKMLEKSIYGYKSFEQITEYNGKSIANGHVSQFYGRATEMAEAFGLSSYMVGENAVKNCPNAKKAHNRLTESPEHNRNYLKQEYEVAGFAVGEKLTYEMFAYIR